MVVTDPASDRRITLRQLFDLGAYPGKLLQAVARIVLTNPVAGDAILSTMSHAAHVWMYFATALDNDIEYSRWHARLPMTQANVWRMCKQDLSSFACA